MLYWRKKVVPPAATPTQDVSALGPVIRQNHIAYIPQGAWSGVPGVGTANLVYAPDFLLSAPEYYAGNALPVNPNSIMVTQTPFFINAPKTVLEGIGGVTAGQMINQPLLQVDANNGNTGTE